MVRQTAVINIMALGMTLIIVSGGIDLSVGAILAMCGLFGTMAMETGLPIPVGVLIGILTGAALRCLERRVHHAAAHQSVHRDAGHAGHLPRRHPDHLQRPAGAPHAAGVLVSRRRQRCSACRSCCGSCWCARSLTHVMLEHTKLGRYAFAIGSNEQAAFYAGIPVSFHVTTVYAIGGMLTGLAGMIEASRLMTGQPTAGQGYELQAIAAVVIGGGSLRGGEGSVVGTLIGAFIMGLLSNGSDLLGISPVPAAGDHRRR